MFLLVVIKILLYLPFIVLWQNEFNRLTTDSLAWILLLGILFTIAYFGFTKGLEVGKKSSLGRRGCGLFSG